MGCHRFKRGKKWKEFLGSRDVQLSERKKNMQKTVKVKNGAASQNSPLPVFYCGEPALTAVRLGGRETRPLVAASDRFQSPSVLCPSQITIHFWLPSFSSIWMQTVKEPHQRWVPTWLSVANTSLVTRMVLACNVKYKTLIKCCVFKEHIPFYYSLHSNFKLIISKSEKTIMQSLLSVLLLLLWLISITLSSSFELCPNFSSHFLLPETYFNLALTQFRKCKYP